MLLARKKILMQNLIGGTLKVMYNTYWLLQCLYIGPYLAITNMTIL